MCASTYAPSMKLCKNVPTNGMYLKKITIIYKE